MAASILMLEIGGTQISLLSSGVYLISYTPSAPQLQMVSTVGDIFDIEHMLVTETIHIHIYGASSVVQSKIQEIERFIARVEHRQRLRSGDRGYLWLQLDSETNTWQSEVLSARLEINEGELHYLTASDGGIDATLVLTRRPWWEERNVQELPLYNTSVSSKTTGGVAIYNHDDATTAHDNWVDIAAADVIGNVPSPLTITMANSNGIGLWTSNFYQTNNVFHSPTTYDLSTFAHIIEGESANGIASIADSASSGGYYGQGVWSGSIGHYVHLFVWDLSPSFLAAAAGDFFRVLCRFASTPPSGIELQLHLKFPSGSPTTTLWEGPKMTATGRLLQDLGIVQLPPGIPSDFHDSLSLILSAKYTGSGQLNVDFLQLTPANSTRWFKQSSYQIEANDQIINDGPVNRVYGLDATTGYQWNIFEVYSGVLYVWPNQNQRLIFLHDEATTMNISRTWTVRAYYRPRRLTI